MTFLKSVEAARARRRENAAPCDNSDIATQGANLAPETVAMSQKSQGGPYPEDADPVAVSQVSQQGPQAGDGNLWRWREYFEERAAIRQYDGGLSRVEAEAAALLDMAARWRGENPLPASDRAACYHCGRSAPCTPVLAGSQGEHAWLHRECWAPMNEKRQLEALDAVTRLLNASKNNA